MSIDSIGSNDDFYNDETGIQGLKTFDADEIVWRGRKVSETLDNRGIHSILKTSLNSRQAVSSGKEKKYESGSFALPFDGYSPHFHYVPGPTPGSRAYTPPPFVPPPVPLHINNPPPPPINFPPPVFVPPPMPQIHYKPPVLVAPTPSPLSNLPPQIVIPSTQITPPSPSPASLPSFESINLLQSTPATLPLSLPTIEALIPLEKTVIASHVLSNPSSTMQDIAKPPKEMALENVPLSLLEGLKHGVVDSVTELPTTISNVVKQGGGYLIDQFVHPLDHILPGQELIAQGFAAKEAISYLRTHDKGALFSDFDS